MITDPAEYNPATSPIDKKIRSVKSLYNPSVTPASKCTISLVHSDERDMHLKLMFECRSKDKKC